MLTLRDYRIGDVDSLVQLANNEHVSRFLIDTFPYPCRTEDASWWIEIGCREPGTITKMIEAAGCFVGSIGLKQQTGWRSHLAEIGYWIGEPYWGRGVATAALVRMCRRAFLELETRKLYAPVLAPNATSMRVLQKCDFKLAGVLADEVFKHGRFYDVHHFERHNPAAESPSR